jgi:hypothetical protein
MKKDLFKVLPSDLRGRWTLEVARNIPEGTEAGSKEGGDTMLFMMICSWEPGDEREVRTRSVTWKWPEDVRVISEYYDLQGRRTIYVVDTDAKGLIAVRAPWRDIMRFEIFPVYPTGLTRESLNL